jgi:hypothetical protein
MSDKRPRLSANERLRVAFGHYILGIEQQDLAALFATNQARINEACRRIRSACYDYQPEAKLELGEALLTELGLAATPDQA